MKNIIVFKSSEVCHNSLNWWAYLLSNSFKKLNVRCIEIELSYEEFNEKIPTILANEKIDAAIVFNSLGQECFSIGNENLWDKYNIPYFDYMVDHPMDRIEDLRKEIKPKKYNVICVDREHAEFASKYFKKIRKSYFLPLWGSGDFDSPLIEYTEFISRKYGFTITMCCTPLENMVEEISYMPSDIQNYIFEWIEVMENNIDLSPHTCLQLMLENKFGKDNVSDELFFSIADKCNIASKYFRNALREEIVTRLIKAGIKIDIFGTGWEKICDAVGNVNTKLHGEISIDKTTKIYKDTKLALNVLPRFKYGMHDRIVTAQVSGAAVYSDSNQYIRDLYESDNDKKIFLYNLKQLKDIDNLVNEVVKLTDNDEKIYEVALNGQKFARENMTWDILASKLYEIMFD